MIQDESPPDRELVELFLQDIEGLSGHEVDEAVEGVTQSDVSRWKRGAYKRLTKKKRRAIEGVIHSRRELEGYLRFQLVREELEERGYGRPRDPRLRREILRAAREIAGQLDDEGFTYGGDAEPGPEATDSTAQLGSLLRSKQALHQTLTEFGGPGQATNDKLSLLELLSSVAARLKREGNQVDARPLVEAQEKVINGDL